MAERPRFELGVSKAHNSFQDCRFKPLSHLSNFWCGFSLASLGTPFAMLTSQDRRIQPLCHSSDEDIIPKLRDYKSELDPEPRRGSGSSST